MSFDKVGSQLSAIRKNLADKKKLQKLGEYLVGRIKKRTRAGFGVKSFLASTHRLPKLSETTVKIRNWYKKKGKLTGPGATPGKSGVNRTGKTIDSLKVNVVSKNQVSLELDGDGEQVATDLIQMDKNYTFMNVSKNEFKDALKETLDKDISKTIKKLFR